MDNKEIKLHYLLLPLIFVFFAGFMAGSFSAWVVSSYQHHETLRMLEEVK